MLGCRVWLRVTKEFRATHKFTSLVWSPATSLVPASIPHRIYFPHTLLLSLISLSNPTLKPKIRLPIFVASPIGSKTVFCAFLPLYASYYIQNLTIIYTASAFKYPTRLCSFEAEAEHKNANSTCKILVFTLRSLYTTCKRSS